MKNVFAAVVATVVMAGPAFADGVDARVDRQQARIVQGVQSGELNAREAVRLGAREQRIENKIAKDRADGAGLSAKEREQIQRRENRTSRAIHRQKHDRQTAK